jgi:hypothetical protein
MHAAKHFVYGGIKLRHILDILMFAKKNQASVHWTEVWRTMREIGLSQWLACAFEIGSRYLGIDLKDVEGYEHLEQPENTALFLNFIFDANSDVEESRYKNYGRYMAVNSGEKHIQALSTNPVAFYFRMLFSGVSSFKGKKYQYVQKHKFLLPVAWAHRIFYSIFVKGGIVKTMREGQYIRGEFAKNADLFQRLRLLK